MCGSANGPAGSKSAAVKDLWNNHRLATIAGAAGVLAIVLAIAGYLILKRPDDKSCPDPCTIETTATPSRSRGRGLAALRP
jgi:hypothetical protein